MNKKLLLWVCLLSSMSGLAQKKTYDIGILLDRRNEKVEPILDQIREQIKVVVGEDALIRFPASSTLVNHFDPERAEENYEQLLKDSTDIILSFGVVNNQIVNHRDYYPKPTILFGAVNREFFGRDLEKETSETNNFTYLIESRSYLEDLKTFQELTEYKKLGIALEAPLVDVLDLTEIFDALTGALGVEYRLIPFRSVSDITGNLEDVDAIYLAGGFFLSNKEIEQLANTFIDRGLPSFTSLGLEEVQLGLMATNQTNENFDQFIRRIALTVEAYVNGTPLSEMPVFIEYSPRLSMNFNTAQKVDVPIKYSLIARTSFVGEIKNEQSDRAFDLIEIIEKVLEQNLLLQSQEKDIDLAGQDLRIAQSNYLPSLTASGTASHVDPDLASNGFGQNPEYSTSGAVVLQQTLFSEAANAGIRIQRMLREAQKENYNAAALDVIFDASNAYFNILILKANVQIQMRNVELTKQNLRTAEQNYEAGQSGKSDVLRFTSQMAQDTQSVVEAVNLLAQGFIVLNQLLNLPLDTQIDIEDVVLDEGLFEEYKYDQLVDLLDSPGSRELFIAFLVEEAKNNAPELKSLGYNLEAVERSLRLNSAGRLLPTVALQGQYNRIFSRSGAGSTAPMGFSLLDDSYNVGVNVSLPILNRNQTNINRRTNIIQKDQLNINKSNIALAIDGNIRNSVLDLINQISNVELSQVAEEAAREALELTQSSYASGAVSIIQLIDAQNNYLNAQLARANAGYNFLINGLQLERALGYYFLLNTEEDNARFNQRFLEFMNTRN